MTAGYGVGLEHKLPGSGRTLRQVTSQVNDVAGNTSQRILMGEGMNIHEAGDGDILGM